MSVGGVLGGLFSALVAPRIFAEVFEYPLLIALSMACRPGVFGRRSASKTELFWLLAIVAAGLLLITRGPALASTLGLTFGAWGITPVLALIFAVAIVAFWGHGARQLAAALMMFAVVVTLPSAVKRGQAQRSYFGVYRVSQSEEGNYNVLTHGTTLHGAQRLRGLDGHLVSDTTPGTYYYPGSPMAAAVRIVQAHRDAQGGMDASASSGSAPARSACYCEKGRTLALFRDRSGRRRHRPEVQLLHVSRQLPAKPDVVIGDARLTLAKEPERSFDLIIVDAFTSDAVPVHLMTAEALQLYAAQAEGRRRRGAAHLQPLSRPRFRRWAPRCRWCPSSRA